MVDQGWWFGCVCQCHEMSVQRAVLADKIYFSLFNSSKFLLLQTSSIAIKYSPINALRKFLYFYFSAAFSIWICQVFKSTSAKNRFFSTFLIFILSWLSERCCKLFSEIFMHNYFSWTEILKFLFIWRWCLAFQVVVHFYRNFFSGFCLMISLF